MRRKRNATGKAATAAPSETLDRICPIPESVYPSSRRYRLKRSEKIDWPNPQRKRP